MLPRHPHRTEDCRAISEILQRVGDKWTVLVVGKLGDGPLRFNELRSAVGGISQKMLTTTLRGLSATASSPAPCFRPFRRASTMS